MKALIICILASIQIACAQDKIPALKLMQTNGTFYTSKDLPKNKPVVLIYFAPDCEHCQKLMAELFKKISGFRKCELVLASFKPLGDIKTFEQQYFIKKYPFIKIGTEGNTFYLRYYYKIEHTPFTALFDKRGKLIVSYRNETPVDELIKKLKALK
jgi:peroxiredoxin